MNHHDLKIWPEYFNAVEIGIKRFELRKNDRNFQVGDTICLHEWERRPGRYTGRKIKADITYKLDGPTTGLEGGYCIFGFNKDGHGNYV